MGANSEPPTARSSGAENCAPSGLYQCRRITPGSALALASEACAATNHPNMMAPRSQDFNNFSSPALQGNAYAPAAAPLTNRASLRAQRGPDTGPEPVARHANAGSARAQVRLKESASGADKNRTDHSHRPKG